jgi:hypothetical protein
MPQAIANLFTSAIKGALEVLAFIVERPPVALAIVVIVLVLIIAAHVHDFLLLPLGIALILVGARLRADGN